MTFSRSGRSATSCHGSHTDRLTPSDNATETTVIAPKNHRRRSRRHTSSPATATTTMPIPTY